MTGEKHPGKGPNAMDPWSAAMLEQNRRWLMAFLLGATGDRPAAEDLVQEVFRIAYEKREQFEAGTNFGGWLRMIARNCLRRYFERSSKRPVLVGDAMAAYEQAAESAEQRLGDPGWSDRRIAALKQCLGKLAVRTRRILELRYTDGERSRAIGAQVGMSVSAVNVTIFRARDRLANCVRRRLAAAQS